MIERNSTDFGFQRVSPEEKTRRVTDVFSSVAGNYDLMNDLMSLGIHRLWKRQAVHIAQVRPGSRVLDLAGGTGDMTALLHDRVGSAGRIVVADINESMLLEGRARLIDQGIVEGVSYLRLNAEQLPFRDHSFDCICMAFGLRNVTRKERALASMRAKLKYGGSVVILEFSRVAAPLLKEIYDLYSFKLIPILGNLVAKDRDSYQYLVESIRKHPDQEELKYLMEDAGFRRVSFYNLSGGVVAIHKGYKL
jgi:demethylmenaquinone methyltransferase/2-methoxy-6-polyprenyl-1,4-benzoquinol methylase